MVASSIRILAFASMLVVAGAASAAVVITETYDSGTGSGAFDVGVGTDDPVLDVGWFAVKNNAATGADTTRFGWTAEIITAADWAAGYPFYIFGVLDTANYPWPELTDDPNGKALFYYAIYLGSGVGGSPIAPGESDAAFEFTTLAPASPWIAGNGEGNLVQYGDTGVVPVPPAAALLALPLWLAGRRRR